MSGERFAYRPPLLLLLLWSWWWYVAGNGREGAAASNVHVWHTTKINTAKDDEGNEDDDDFGDNNLNFSTIFLSAVEED